MKYFENISVLIPALNPDNKLVDLVKELNRIGLANIVVIDDGSESSSHAVFDEVQTYQAQVYHHRINQGKGAALKTGIELYNAGIATLTAGSFLRGIFDIAGTSAAYPVYYFVAGTVFVGAGVLLYSYQWIQIKM